MARPSGGLITIFRMKLSKFSEIVLQFDHFHITFNSFNEQAFRFDSFISNVLTSTDGLSEP